MFKLAVASFVVVAALCGGHAQAFETFIPMGFGYSSSNVDPSSLSARERAAIGQADVYETEIYQRQLRARQIDSWNQRFRSDPNADVTDHSIDY